MQRHGVMTLFSRGRWLPLAAAAALVIGVVGLGIYFVPDRPRSGPTYRADEGDWIRPAFPSDQLLPRGLCTLRWTLGPEGTTYDVVVTTQDLDPLARGWRLETPEFTVSAELLRDLPAAARIHWRVTAYLLDGRRVTSNTFTTLIE